MFSQRLSLPPSAFPPFQGKPWGQALPCSHGGGWSRVGRDRSWGVQGRMGVAGLPGCLLLSPGPPRHPDPFHHTSTGHGPSQTLGCWGSTTQQPPQVPPTATAQRWEKNTCTRVRGQPYTNKGPKGPAETGQEVVNLIFSELHLLFF